MFSCSVSFNFCGHYCTALYAPYQYYYRLFVQVSIIKVKLLWRWMAVCLIVYILTFLFLRDDSPPPSIDYVGVFLQSLSAVGDFTFLHLWTFTVYRCVNLEPSDISADFLYIYILISIALFCM